MGFFGNIVNGIHTRVDSFAMAGTWPQVMPPSLDNIMPAKGQTRLCELVRDEGEEALSYLTYDWVHRRKVEMVEFARTYGMRAMRRRYNTRTLNPPMRAVALSLLRILVVGLATAGILISRYNYEWLAVTLLVVGLQCCVEGWIYLGNDIMGKIFAFFRSATKPQIWRDPVALGKLYLDGNVDASELAFTLALARGIKGRCSYDDTRDAFTVGTSTGQLRAAGVTAAPSLGIPLKMTLSDMATGTLFVGSTGSGKTQAINAMVAQLMTKDENGPSIIIMDPKRSAMLDIYNVLRSVDPEIRKSYALHVVGPDKWQDGFNPIDSRVSTPEQASATLLDLIRSEGAGTGDSEYWSSMVVELVFAASTILDIAGLPRNLGNVYRYLTDTEEMDKINNVALLTAPGLSQEELLARVLDQIRVNLVEAPEKTKGNIISSISSWIGRFALPGYHNWSASASLDDIYQKKSIWVIDVPDTLGKPGRLLRYFFFRQVYDLALSRLAKRGNDRHIIMVCDEVQESTNAESFKKSALSREAKLCVVAASQSVSQLLKVWGGKESTDTILANFRTKVLLSTDDPETRNRMKLIVSEGEVPEHSYGTSTTKTIGFQAGGGGASGLMSGNVMGAVGGLGSTNISKSWTTSRNVNLKRGPMRDELFDSLGPQSAVAVINWSGARRKSILEIEGIFLKKDRDMAQALQEDYTRMKAQQTAEMVNE